MDRGAWWAAVHGVTKSQTQLSDFTFTSLPPVTRPHLGSLESWPSLPWPWWRLTFLQAVALVQLAVTGHSGSPVRLSHGPTWHLAHSLCAESRFPPGWAVCTVHEADFPGPGVGSVSLGFPS